MVATKLPIIIINTDYEEKKNLKDKNSVKATTKPLKIFCELDREEESPQKKKA